MEIKDIVNNVGILGVVGNYRVSIEDNLSIKEVIKTNYEDTLKMVELSYLNENTLVKDLTISELFKIDLASKINNDLIIIGNMYNSLIYKDREFIRKLLLKIHDNYNKKIIIIDNNIISFFNLAKEIAVVEGDLLIYRTKDFFDKELYKYTNKPKIIDFIEYLENCHIPIDRNIEIYELLKNIYRIVS